MQIQLVAGQSKSISSRNSERIRKRTLPVLGICDLMSIQHNLSESAWDKFNSGVLQ